MVRKRMQEAKTGDAEAMEEFVARGGMIGTTIGPKGTVENDKDSYNYQKQLQDKKFEKEAQKLWFRMRNEVIQELQEKGNGESYEKLQRDPTNQVCPANIIIRQQQLLEACNKAPNSKRVEVTARKKQQHKSSHTVFKEDVATLQLPVRQTR
ncbi:hypothetical protein D5086_002249 [Populus alba]|uniref:Uncharacterized protein n=1 Tax=Populus alba TaxID=43335 RepID=A0ACC4D2E8_POPAL